MTFKLLCIDLFQTLVDVDARYVHIWTRILGDAYDHNRVSDYLAATRRHVFLKFQQYSGGDHAFTNMKTMFQPFFQAALEALDLPLDADRAVDIFFEEHTKAEPFGDVHPFFASLPGEMPVCLVTDADRCMLPPLVDQYPLDALFLSETAGAYKRSPDARIFFDVLDHYAIAADEVLHVGDSPTDIIGANRAGIQTCWINRTGAVWTGPIAPDYTVTSLMEVPDILSS